MTQDTHDMPCPCWTAVSLHGDPEHCCFREWDGETRPLPCGHEKEGLAIDAAYQASLGPDRCRRPGRRPTRPPEEGS